MDEDHTRLLRPRRPADAPPVPPAPEEDEPTQLMAHPLRPAPSRPAPVEPTVPARIVAEPEPEPSEVERTVLYRPNSAVAPALARPAESAPQPVTGWLVVRKGPGRGQALALSYGNHSLGRGDDQRLRLPYGDDGIARQNHAVISYDGKGRQFYAAPGGSEAMAYHNGRPLLQPVVLEGGDVLTLGATELAFVRYCGPAFDWQDA